MQGAPPPFHREPTLKCPLYYGSIIIRGSTIRGVLLYFMSIRDSQNFEAAHLKKERRKQTWSLDDFQVPYFHNAVCCFDGKLLLQRLMHLRFLRFERLV